MLVPKNPHYRVRADLPDWRDLPYHPQGNPLRPVVDLRTWASPVEDQEHLGACTGNAVVGAYELLMNRERPQDFRDLSRLFVYYNARLLEEDVAQDVGAEIRDAVRAARQYGLCLESIWPYNIQNFAVTPSTTSYEDAQHRTIRNYYRVSTLEDALDALNNNWPIVFSLRVYDGFEALDDGDSLVPTPGATDQPIGGHAMVMVGYDLAQQRVLCRNSFGRDWCQGGYCWITFDYVRNEVMDMWIFDIALNN